MTDAPDLDPAGLEAATNKAEKIIRAVRDLIVAESKHLRRQTSHGDSERLEADDAHAALLDFTAVDCAEALRIVERRRAARSTAPEAGKAVVKPLDLSNLLRHAFMFGFETMGGTADAAKDWWPEYNPEECPAFDRILSALASSPSPTGAEPVGESGTMPGTDGFTMACFKATDVPIGTKLYASPQAVAPTGEIAGLVEVEKIDCVTYERGWQEPADPIWRIQINGVCADFPTETWANNFADAIRRTIAQPLARLAEAEEALTASEAEATDLRHKLGELLAVIHRDGGHYQDFAGTEQTVADAHSAVTLLFQAQDERNDLRRNLEEAERERDAMVCGLSAVVHCQSSLTRSSMRNAAADILERVGRKPVDFGGDQSPFVARAEAAERKLEEARKALEPFEELADEGNDDQPDDTKVIIHAGRSTIYTLRLADLRAARAAYRAIEGSAQ